MRHEDQGALGVWDSPRRYGKVTRLLHWGLAALVLWQFLGMGLKQVMDRDSWVSVLVGSHQPVGVVIFALVVLRGIWALLNRKSRPSHGAGLLGAAAAFGHLALYGLMFVVPLLALMRAYANDRVFAPFGVEIFSAKDPKIDWMINLAGNFHGELGWLFAAVILGHVGMVAVHERLWKDGTLAKMAGR